MIQQMAQPVQVTKVNGENGARAYQIGANSSALLLDESGLLVWLVTSDGAGYKTVTPYDIKPHQTAPAPDYGSLEGRIKKLEDIVNEYTADSSAIRRKVNDPAADPANDQPDRERSQGGGQTASPDCMLYIADSRGMLYLCCMERNPYRGFRQSAQDLELL